jgi:hypothetical protein
MFVAAVVAIVDTDVIPEAVEYARLAKPSTFVILSATVPKVDKAV